MDTQALVNIGQAEASEPAKANAETLGTCVQLITMELSLSIDGETNLWHHVHAVVMYVASSYVCSGFWYIWSYT